MFQPVSDIDYLLVDPNLQILVCALDDPPSRATLHTKWEKRATAIFCFRAGDDILDVVRDLLANPQIRAVVFEGVGEGLADFYRFWRGDGPMDLQGIAEEHATAVKQFVDLYDGDCTLKEPLQPFWPTRLCYKSGPKAKIPPKES